MRETGGRYEPVLTYSYNVDGRWRQSDRYDFRAYSSMSLWEAQEAVDLYPVGKPALCYANPSHPEEAVLYPYDDSPHARYIPFLLADIIPPLIVLLKGRRRPAVPLPHRARHPLRTLLEDRLHPLQRRPARRGVPAGLSPAPLNSSLLSSSLARYGETVNRA